MNIILIILGIMVAIIGIFLIVALFTKKEYAIEREITIDKPGQEVFDYIKYLRNQDHYNKWVMADPGMKKDFRGTDGTAGALYAWESNNKKIGKGELEIRKITEGKRVDYEIHFIKPFEGKATAYMTTEAEADQESKIKWGISSGMKYPMNITLVLFNIEGMMGKDLQTSLANLKNILEKRA